MKSAGDLLCRKQLFWSLFDFRHKRFFQKMFHRKLVCEKVGERLIASSIENFLEDDSAILKALYLKIVRKVCLPIKENHEEIAENLYINLVKSDHINHVLISTAGL